MPGAGDALEHRGEAVHGDQHGRPPGRRAGARARPRCGRDRARRFAAARAAASAGGRSRLPGIAVASLKVTIEVAHVDRPVAVDRQARIGLQDEGFSATVKCGASRDSWCTMAMPLRAASCGVLIKTSRPCQSMRPPSRSSMPATIFISVDLPAPFSPSRRCTSPASTERFPSERAVTPPNLFWMPVSWRSTGSEQCTKTNRRPNVQ